MIPQLIVIANGEVMSSLLEGIKISERNTCRASGGKLIEVLDLGMIPFSSFPKDPKEELPKLPLVLCLNEESGLVQLKHSVDPDAMYQEYWYMSGVNQSMQLALKSIVDEALARTSKPLKAGSIVVDIASNDGTLLSAYPSDFFRIGIDPAKNITPKNCNLHINTYFSAAAYQAHMGTEKAEIVTSIAMFYDLEDPISFSRDVASILSPGGLWIIELSYLPTMLEKNSFDTICSEHLEYYSLTSIEYILKQSGMEVEDVELNDINGGSFRLYIRHKGYAQETDAVKTMRLKEEKLSLLDPATYLAFGDRIQKNRDEMLSFLKNHRGEVIGYGASTKGNTILAYYGIDSDLIPYVADRNPIKWGRHTVTGIPIISEEKARALNPRFFLAFPYHFMSEFLSREAPFLQSGGRFISPIPELTLSNAHS